MSHNVQKYDKQVYLRVSEAQRCRVHSTLVMPVFDGDNRCKPLAVFELVQSDKDVVFPEVISWLRSCLEVSAEHLFWWWWWGGGGGLGVWTYLLAPSSLHMRASLHYSIHYFLGLRNIAQLTYTCCLSCSSPAGGSHDDC